MLRQKVNPKTGKKQYCLVSRKDPSKILEWYGSAHPSEETVAKTEKRVQWFKHRMK